MPRPRPTTVALLAVAALLGVAQLSLAQSGPRLYLPFVPNGATPSGGARTPTATATPTTTSAAASPTPTGTTAPALELIGEVQFQPQYARLESDGPNVSCAPVVEDWKGALRADEFTPAGGLIYPNVGEVLLTEAMAGTQLRTPIRAGAGGALSYAVANMEPGIYQLRAYLFYKHPQEGQARLYGRLFVGDEVFESIVVSVSGAGLLRQDLRLVLSGNVCAAP